MDLTPYISRLQRELSTAADTGSDETQAAAARLIASVESAARLVLLEALSAATGEISLELDDASVDVRLRGGDPDFVVTRQGADVAPRTAASAGADEDDATARISLRLPERLKHRVERAAEDAEVSVNTWLVRAVSETLDRSVTTQRSGGRWMR